jgi:hypothetical protein
LTFGIGKLKAPIYITENIHIVEKIFQGGGNFWKSCEKDFQMEKSFHHVGKENPDRGKKFPIPK